MSGCCTAVYSCVHHHVLLWLHGLPDLIPTLTGHLRQALRRLLSVASTQSKEMLPQELKGLARNKKTDPGTGI